MKNIIDQLKTCLKEQNCCIKGNDLDLVVIQYGKRLFDIEYNDGNVAICENGVYSFVNDGVGERISLTVYEPNKVKYQLKLNAAGYAELFDFYKYVRKEKRCFNKNCQQCESFICSRSNKEAKKKKDKILDFMFMFQKVR